MKLVLEEDQDVVDPAQVEPAVHHQGRVLLRAQLDGVGAEHGAAQERLPGMAGPRRGQAGGVEWGGYGVRVAGSREAQRGAGDAGRAAHGADGEMAQKRHRLVERDVARAQRELQAAGIEEVEVGVRVGPAQLQVAGPGEGAGRRGQLLLHQRFQREIEAGRVIEDEPDVGDRRVVEVVGGGGDVQRPGAGQAGALEERELLPVRGEDDSVVAHAVFGEQHSFAGLDAVLHHADGGAVAADAAVGERRGCPPRQHAVHFHLHPFQAGANVPGYARSKSWSRVSKSSRPLPRNVVSNGKG